MRFKTGVLLGQLMVLTCVLIGLGDAAHAQTRKPNILVIWGDDIGQFNISTYNRGMMGYRTPNIDSIAAQGAVFTDWYGQQSCTAGRAAFVTGQSPIRTGLTKVGALIGTAVKTGIGTLLPTGAVVGTGSKTRLSPSSWPS